MKKGAFLLAIVLLFLYLRSELKAAELQLVRLNEPGQAKLRAYARLAVDACLAGILVGLIWVTC